MQLYTRTGDDGTTSLAGGQRVPKNHPRVCAYGDIDELMSMLGLIGAWLTPADSHGDLELSAEIRTAQSRLFTFGAYLAAPGGNKSPNLPISEPRAEWVRDVEQSIDLLQKAFPNPRCFVLPGGTVSAAHCHLARTVCRRAERSLETLFSSEPDSKTTIMALLAEYLNRLSDLLFAMAIAVNRLRGIDETAWDRSGTAEHEISEG